MYRLIVKNFGVLKDIDIKLNKTNLFIGENGSGKSVLAKLITIVTNRTLNKDEILLNFKDFEINFIDDKTIIELKENIDTLFLFKDNTFKSFDKLDELQKKYLNIKDEIQFHKFIDELENDSKIEALIYKISNIKEKDIIQNTRDNSEKKDTLFKIEKDYKKLESQYIPTERNLISLFNNSLSNLLTADIPLPKSLLEFSAQYNSARKEIKEIELLNMRFESKNGQDKIYYDKDNFLPLEQSSSGIQSALPLYLTVKYFNNKHKNIIIEEPELNLFPKAQADTTKFIVENSENNLYLMTHSPYILSTLNSLLFAYKASNKNDVLKKKIENIIPESQHINPDEFSAYLLEDGKSVDIVSKRGLIRADAINDCSDDIDDEFNELMELYREFKDV